MILIHNLFFNDIDHLPLDYAFDDNNDADNTDLSSNIPNNAKQQGRNSKFTHYFKCNYSS